MSETLDRPGTARLPAGIHFDVSEKAYHADCAEEPSLSAGFGKTLLDTSPARAAHSHPRLNPAYVPSESSTAMDEGSALHRLILGAGPEIAVIEADSYRTNAAKFQRDRAKAARKIPVLMERALELDVIAAFARKQLETHSEAREVLSEDYASEVTLIWREDTGAMCRARADRMHRTDGRAPIYDFKFTDRLVSPFAFDRHALDNWWDMRAAFYQRGACTLRHGEVAPYRFVVVEKQPPYDILVLELLPEFMGLGERKAEAAIDAWEQCVAAGEWPPYPRRVFHISPPGFAESRWMERPSMQHMLPPRKPLPGERESLLAFIERDPVNPMMSG